MDHELALAWCGLHPDRSRSLVDEWGSARAVHRAINHGHIKVSEAVRELAAASPQDQRARLDRMGCDVITPADPAYPPRLAEIPNRPRLLFVKGGITNAPTVAIVGTRRCTSYGRALAEAYGRAIADAGWVLVSGLARGIDGAAHRGTVAAGGVGVGVLGCGIDVSYPREHERLAAALIGNGGAIVSEYPPGAPPEPWRFPPRNRIISAMADAVVVVEANVTGGALITAGTALEQGRAVFAVPGDIGRDSSQGTNRLIRDGAHPVFDPADLIEELALIVGPPVVTRASADDDQSHVLSAIPAGGIAVDDLAAILTVDAAALLADLTRLEVLGHIRHEGAVVYST